MSATQQLPTSGERIVDNVLYGADAMVATWIQERLGAALVQVPFVAFGVVDSGRIVGGAYYFNHHDGVGQRDVSVAVAIDDSAAVNPAVVGRLLEYPFVQLGVPRITGEIDLSNERAVEQATRLGFLLEGTKRRASPDGGSIGIFGLLPDECEIWQRWKAQRDTAGAMV